MKFRIFLVISAFLMGTGSSHAQPSGPAAAAYQIALSKCAAANTATPDAFDACMRVQGFSQPMVSPVPVGPPSTDPMSFPIPMPGIERTGLFPGFRLPTPEPANTTPSKVIEAECRAANGVGIFYEACLKSSGVIVQPNSSVIPPLSPSP